MHEEVEMQVPDPYGVEHVALVQHSMSLDPGQYPAVAVPEQHPAETLTHAPSTPETVHVAVYEHDPRPSASEAELLLANGGSAAALLPRSCACK